MRPYAVQRFDDNPTNTYTFGTWVHVSSFTTRDEAQAYVSRASGPSQRLSVVERIIVPHRPK